MRHSLTLSPLQAVGLALGAALALLTLWALAAAGAYVAGTSPAAHAQGAPADTPAQGITVYGEGEASAEPAIAMVTLSVQTEGRTAREALDANSAAMGAVVDALKGLGIPDRHLRTTGISVNPVRARPRPEDPQPPPITGYQASNSLSVTVDPLSRAGEVIDVAVSAGANVAGGLRFALRDDAELQHRALEAAVRAARAKADVVAAAAGVRITGVRAVTEEPMGGVPVVRAELAQAADARTAPPVQPGELTLRTRVRVVYTFG